MFVRQNQIDYSIIQLLCGPFSKIQITPKFGTDHTRLYNMRCALANFVAYYFRCYFSYLSNSIRQMLLGDNYIFRCTVVSHEEAQVAVNIFLF